MAHPVIHHTKRVLNKPHLVLPVTIVVALGIGIMGYLSLNTSKNYVTTPVVLGSVAQELSTTGTVKAATETSLAFPKGGRVSSISVKAGDFVYKGQTLASLDSSDAQGSVESAQGAYLAAKANYDRLINGASGSDLSIAQIAYDSTVQEQNLAVKNAQQKLLSSDLLPTTTSSTTYIPPVISGTYLKTETGTITVDVYATGDGAYFTARGLTSSQGSTNSANALPLGDSGLQILFPSGTHTMPATWTITIPNISGPNYTANNTAYQLAVQTSTDKIAQAKAALDKVKSAPRSEDIAQAEAQVSSALGALHTAQAALANDFIVAPITGTITSVGDVSTGSIVSANTPVIVIMSQGAFQIDSFVSEKDLALVSVNEPVSITTDAYGPSVSWKGSIIAVAPAATTGTTGQLGYKVTYQFTDTDTRLKPGLSASVNLLGQKKDNVLIIPRTAIFQKDGHSFVLIKNGKTTENREVTVGLVGNSTAEILSGLTAGEQVVTLGNN